jgi:arylsulfatase A-like enzyme
MGSNRRLLLPPTKPNILVIWGDDIGQSNISAYTRA